MLPLIFISNSLEKQERFIQDFLKKETFLPYFIYKIKPVKTEISIDQIRAIKKEIIFSIPSKRLIIVYAFDTASLEAQNAFLKTLEEKNEKNQFILLVNDIGRILPTIISRSKTLLDSNDTQEVQTTNTVLEELEEKKDFSFLKHTSGINREDALKLFDLLIVQLREQLAEGSKLKAVILKKALIQKSLLLNNNLNPQLAVDSFLLFYKKILK